MFYESFDLWLASFLRVSSIPYRGCTLTKNDKFLFRFVKDDRIPSLVDRYHYGAEVEVKKLAEAYKFLADEIRRHRKEGAQ